ncbi:MULTISPECIES: pyruvate, phosphate dikinase [Streptomyces]|uniref:pyruvate, phosphate dikinase n=1 Tax=Streptomyces TaxID=1883 RepID=UPI00163CC695|nr:MULTISPECIES: pyruvate, phosphate dikinase [Streptomyces]MBC2874269.1 pyruvate, phosphate dikinase [Streptomyces sp. TYQ1024]UBI40304.1 pyruvate, phosphate dikinase [Streptomyces mobaraensis]UKW32884.1 pyruvate, phosphate dikinase [Streptomyces sp. TYQ1024]
MRWIRALSARSEETAETVGGKALGLVVLHRLALPVPAGFVITTEGCRAFLRDGRLPEGLGDELATAMADLERSTGRAFGGPHKPLAVSVRSGASVSMPGMMSTILNLGLTAAATEGLAAETADRPFALASRLNFLTSFASATTNVDTAPAAPAERPGRRTENEEASLIRSVEAVEKLVRRRSGRSVPDDANHQLTQAVEAVFSSWDTPRARTYREVNGIPHDLGTAVIVQHMVFGNRDARSGTGVAFSRDPATGENVPFGEVLFGRQGEEVVSGRSTTRPLRELAEREPEVWAGLLDALRRIEGHYRDACYVEFTYQSGELWLLQVRPGRFVGGAAVRVATELVDQGLIGREEALLRVSPLHLRHVRTPRIASAGEADVLARGTGACPGVATGRIATTADDAVRMARTGPVVLVRPETSPNDMHGLAAATGIVTARGGPASHAAVVARAMGKPAVVGVPGLTVDGASVTAAGRTLPEGTLITVDGTSGDVALGSPRVVTDAADAHVHRLLAWADDASGDHSAARDETQRLDAAHRALRDR